jgi:hypothetical protein
MKGLNSSVVVVGRVGPSSSVSSSSIAGSNLGERNAMNRLRI